MKKMIQVLGLVVSLLMGSVTFGSAAEDKYPGVGYDDTVTIALKPGTYRLVIEPINNYIGRLGGVTLWNFSNFAQSPLGDILVDESWDDALQITGHETSLRKIDIVVDEQAKEILIRPKKTLFWCFPSGNMNLKLGVPLRYVEISTSGSTKFRYENAVVERFEFITKGRVDAFLSFLGSMKLLNIDLASAGTVEYYTALEAYDLSLKPGQFGTPDTPQIIESSKLSARGASQILGYGPQDWPWALRTRDAEIYLSGSSRLEVCMTTEGSLHGKIYSRSKVFYDYDRRETQWQAELGGPDVRGIDVSGGLGRIEKRLYPEYYSSIW